MNSLDLWYQPELLSVLALAATSLCPKPRNADCLQVPLMPTNGHHQIPSKSLQVLGDRRPSHKSKLLSGAQSDRLGKSVYKTDCTKLCSCENVLDWFSCEQTTKRSGAMVTHVSVGRKKVCDTEGLIDQVLCRFELFNSCVSLCLAENWSASWPEHFLAMGSLFQIEKLKTVDKILSTVGCSFGFVCQVCTVVVLSSPWKLNLLNP